MKSVLLIEEQVKQYRAPLYATLYQMLRRRNINLQVAYSAPRRECGWEQDCQDLPPEYGRRVSSYRYFGGKLLYQPLLRQSLAADLVILDEGNRFFLNYLLLPLSLLRLKKVAFWGMGANRLAGSGSLPERFRRWRTTKASWWFAYTAGTAEHVADLGFPFNRITNVNNSTDSRSFRTLVSEIEEGEKDQLRAEFGIGREDPVAVFCGRLHPTKNLPFLLQSARLIKQKCPRFHLILIGGGPTQFAGEVGSNTAAWIHVTGARVGRDKAALFSISDVLLMPEAVGLVIVDAFAAGLPLLTTDSHRHGPEIEYLQSGGNGLMTSADVEQFAMATAEVLSRRDYLAHLQKGAWLSGGKYSIETMAHNFSVGIATCLEGRTEHSAHKGEAASRTVARER